MAQTQDEQAALNVVMQLLEATPDTAAPTGIANLGLPANDIPAKREKLAILVSTGKSKEAIGVQPPTNMRGQYVNLVYTHNGDDRYHGWRGRSQRGHFHLRQLSRKSPIWRQWPSRAG